MRYPESNACWRQTDWEETTSQLRTSQQMSEAIQTLSVADQQVWYRSGRMFHGDEDD
jgi:hypothetical protein